MQSDRSTIRRPNRNGGPLSLKLAGLFLLSFVVFFVGFFAYDVLTSFAINRASEDQLPDTVAPIVIDPNIGNELAKVLTTEDPAVVASISDPFVDHAGLSRKAAVSSTLVQGQQPESTGQTSNPINGTTGGSGGAASSSPVKVVISPGEATKQRYAEWLAGPGGRGDERIDSRIFAIADLLPVGIVDGGNGSQEILFYSEAIERTFSFPLGTRFYDGWLTELRSEGVVFSFNDDRHSVRLRSWTKSLKTEG